MAWEYSYHCGQAQEDLSDRLVPASLYGMKVVRPGYLSAYHGPATSTQATAACDSGRGYLDHISDSDVHKNARLVAYARQGHQHRALFICPQPKCMMAWGHSFLFAILEQWVAHWNIFHVAVAPLFHCMVRGCDYKTAVATDSLDLLFRHIMDAHQKIYADGDWPNLVDLASQPPGLHLLALAPTRLLPGHRWRRC